LEEEARAAAAEAERIATERREYETALTRQMETLMHARPLATQEDFRGELTAKALSADIHPDLFTRVWESREQIHRAFLEARQRQQAEADERARVEAEEAARRAEETRQLRMRAFGNQGGLPQPVAEEPVVAQPAAAVPPAALPAVDAQPVVVQQAAQPVVADLVERARLARLQRFANAAAPAQTDGTK
jgi:hypothetical protein